jgi:hypothetical protein
LRPQQLARLVASQPRDQVVAEDAGRDLVVQLARNALGERVVAIAHGEDERGAEGHDATTRLLAGRWSSRRRAVPCWAGSARPGATTAPGRSPEQSTQVRGAQGQQPKGPGSQK